MRIHYLQHVPFEGLGCIETWARDQGHGLFATALFKGESFPDPEDFDFLVVMGGPMGVYDTDQFRWLSPESEFIARSIQRGKKCLGICLGAQLIAKALGSKVYPHSTKEIGWHTVTRCAPVEGADKLIPLPESFYAFHWHGDTFDLPDGAVHLARSKACQNQAYFYPPATWGFQFHLESTRHSVAELIRHCGDELIPGPHIQSKSQILDQDTQIQPSNEIMHSVLNFIEKI